MSQVTSSLIHSFIGRYAFILINLASMMTYARMLTPEEIGVHVIAIAASSIIIELRLIGTGSYLIKLKKVTREDTENVLFVTLCISLFLGFGLLLISDLLSNFYSTPGMSSVIEILFGTFLITPFTAVSQSYFERTFNFKILVAINVLSAFFAFILTVVLIKLGLSYLSLAIGILFSQLFQFLAHFFLKSYQVSWIPRPGNIKKILRFGGTLTLVTFITKSLESLPELLLGKFIGTGASALFSRALGVVKFSNETVLGFVSPIVTPYLSEARRNGGYLASAFEKATNHVTVIVVPILLSLAVIPDVAISVLFGEQWLEASELVAILCITFAIQAPIQFLKNMLIVEEKEIYILLAKLFSLPIFLALGLTIGKESLLRMAIAFSFTQIFEVGIFYFIAIKCIKFQFRVHLLNQLKSYVIAITCMLVSFLTHQVSGIFKVAPILEGLIQALILSITWLSLVIIIKHDIVNSINQAITELPFPDRFKTLKILSLMLGEKK